MVNVFEHRAVERDHFMEKQEREHEKRLGELSKKLRVTMEDFESADVERLAEIASRERLDEGFARNDGRAKSAGRSFTRCRVRVGKKREGETRGYRSKIECRARSKRLKTKTRGGRSAETKRARKATQNERRRVRSDETNAQEKRRHARKGKEHIRRDEKTMGVSEKSVKTSFRRRTIGQREIILDETKTLHASTRNA